MRSGAKQTLRDFRAPDEAGAERRAWTVVRAAYLEREPARSRAAPAAPGARPGARRRRRRPRALARRREGRPHDHPCARGRARRARAVLAALARTDPCPGRAGPGPRPPTARPVTSGRGGRRAGRRAGCIWRLPRRDQARRGRPSRQRALGDRPPGRQRPAVVLAVRLSGRLPVGRHAADDRRRRNVRSSAGRPRRAVAPAWRPGRPSARSSSRT